VGGTIVVQELWHGEVWAARPMRVVHDEPELLALWFPRGTRWQAPTAPPGRPVPAARGEKLAGCLARRQWAFVEHAWDVDTLCLLQPDAWHAVWISWLPDGRQWGWYVNLQEPYRRTTCGIATFDLALDVIIDVDGSWRWKDEDELLAYVEHGVVEPALAEQLYAEGNAVVARHRAERDVFGSDWPSWRPDPAWPQPVLRAGWNVPCP
jgi:hypothetical protein